jgi:integrase
VTNVRIRYVQAWVDEEGRAHHYFRRRGFRRVPLPGLPGSPEFMAAYESAMQQPAPPIGQEKRSRPGSVAAAIAAYLDSMLYFGSRAPATQQMQRAILERFREQYGEHPIDRMPAEFIARLLSKKKPHAARNWLKTLHALCAFAKDHAMIKTDPTHEVTLPKLKDSGGWHSWTAEEVAAYEAHHPIGSKARLALALAIYTGQRRGNVIRMGRQHITKDGAIIVRQQKTGAELTIPLHPELAGIIAATPGDHLNFLTSKSGRQYAANDFSEQFRVWCNEAGLPARCKFHGLRKHALTRLADAGASVHEIAAISGHKTLREIERYTRARDQKRLAASAMDRMANGSVKPEKTEVSKPLKQITKKRAG